MKNVLSKVAVFSLILPLVLGFSAGCTTTTEEESQSPIEITDQLGRTVTLEKAPERIVSLAPSNTEILYALGLGDKVVGVTKSCDYPTEVTEKPIIGGFSSPNLEEIVALSPDLVIAASRHEEEIIPQLEEKGITVLGLNPKTFDSILSAITLIGDVTGNNEEASQLVADMESRIKAVTDKVSDLTEDEKPRVFYLTWHDPLKTSGATSLNNELIEKAGGKNIFIDVTGVQTIDLEMLVARDPQVMIAGTGMGTGEENTLLYLQEESRLDNTEASKNGSIYGINIDITGRGGPRIVEGLEHFAKCIHPKTFGQLEN
ncbi:ABC transporter substrate-binding protein [Chloroflexota bacterium]